MQNTIHAQLKFFDEMGLSNLYIYTEHLEHSLKTQPLLESSAMLIARNTVAGNVLRD